MSLDSVLLLFHWILQWNRCKRRQKLIMTCSCRSDHVLWHWLPAEELSCYSFLSHFWRESQRTLFWTRRERKRRKKGMKIVFLVQSWNKTWYVFNAGIDLCVISGGGSFRRLNIKNISGEKKKLLSYCWTNRVVCSNIFSRRLLSQWDYGVLSAGVFCSPDKKSGVSSTHKEPLRCTQIEVRN